LILFSQAGDFFPFAVFGVAACASAAAFWVGECAATFAPSFSASLNHRFKLFRFFRIFFSEISEVAFLFFKLRFTTDTFARFRLRSA